MDLRRCMLVVAGVAASMLVAWFFGIFEPAALAPSRVIEGHTRSLIAIAVVLVPAMIIVATCRRDPARSPVAKNGNDARNKTKA